MADIHAGACKGNQACDLHPRLGCMDEAQPVHCTQVCMCVHCTQVYSMHQASALPVTQADAAFSLRWVIASRPQGSVCRALQSCPRWHQHSSVMPCASRLWISRGHVYSLLIVCLPLHLQTACRHTEYANLKQKLLTNSNPPSA